MDTISRLFANILHVTRFGCSCPAAIANSTDKGSHTIRVCDPNFYGPALQNAFNEAANTVTEKLRCQGPWQTQTWAIHPPDRDVPEPSVKRTKIIAANKPQLYPGFFDFLLVTGESNDEVIEYIEYSIPATHRNSLIIGILPTQPSRKVLEALVKNLNPVDAFCFEGIHVVIGQHNPYALKDRPITTFEASKIQSILNMYEYASINTVTSYTYAYHIPNKGNADIRVGVEPVANEHFDPKELPTHLAAESAWTNEALHDDIFDNKVYNKLQPIEPLLAGHLGLLLPVGYLNNTIIYDKASGKDPIIIKGSVEKFEEIIEEQPNKIVTEESYEIRITTMNLKTGEINYIGEEDDISLPDFLADNQTALYKSAKSLFPPSVDYDHKDVDKFITRLKTLKRPPVGKQGATIISLASHIRDNKNAFCIGQQGSGKTFIALGVATALNYNKVMVMCPTHAVETWRREIKETYPDAVVLKPSGISGTSHTDTEIPLDKIADLKCTKPTFILLPKDISKLGFSEKLNLRKATLVRSSFGKVKTEEYMKDAMEDQPEECPLCGSKDLVLRKNHKLIKSHRRYTVRCTECTFPRKELYTCPTCWQPIQDIDRLINLDTDEVIPKKVPKQFQTCHNHIINVDGDSAFSHQRYKICGAPYTTPDTDARFHHRIPYGEYIAKYLYTWPDLFIIDELHQYKGKDSLQTAIAGKIAQRVKKTLGLTGTFMGGYAANLYWLFEHFIPCFPEDAVAWNKESSFVEHYGKYRHTYKMNRKQFDRMMMGRLRKQTGQRTQIPGYHPELLKFILPTSVFVKIYDINRELQAPKITAKLIPLDTSSTYSDGEVSLTQAKAYNKLKQAMEDNAVERVKRGENYNILALIHELVAYPENCCKETTPIDSSTEKPIITIPEIKLKGDNLLPKERELVEIILQEVVEQKRKCLIYCTHTNEKATWTRIVDILNDHPSLPNVKCAFMNSKGAAETRLSRLEQLAEKNDIVIIQPQAVETGLNLQQFPTIIWYEPHLSIYTSEQASARSHRINQKDEVRIYYLAYAGTYQERQLRLLADKRDVSSTITGVINEDSLSNLNAKQMNLREILAKEIHDNNKFVDERSIDERATEIASLFNQQTEELTTQLQKDNEVLLDSATASRYEWILDNSTEEILHEIELVEAAPDTPTVVTVVEEPQWEQLIRSAQGQQGLF